MEEKIKIHIVLTVDSYLDSENRNNFLFLLFAGFSKYFTTSTVYSKKISPTMNTSGFCI